MTLSYSELVFTSKGVGTFLKLLLKWQGSIYKLVWRELIIYMFIYTSLAVTYRLLLSEQSKYYFEQVCVYCGTYGNQIPITFVLGFYVSLIITRWWNQFESIPWPDSAAMWISTCIHGQDEQGRLMRRTIVRYVNLSLILVLRLISLPVKKRFPTLEHLMCAGIMEQKEMELIAAMEQKANQRSFWMPLVWAGSIVIRARKENRVKNDPTVKALLTEIDNFRAKAGKLLHYEWIPVPLVYTQVVTLAVYSYLLSTLLGRQFLNPEKKYPGYEFDFYVPFFSFLQFFFYIGWLKVAEALINPFGEDDDDFETNWIIDRNLCISYLIVDEMHSDHPDLVRDQYWDEQYPELPYTAAAEVTKNADPCVGPTANVEVSEELGQFVDDLQVVVTSDKSLLITDDEEEMKKSLSNGSRSTLNTLKLNQGSSFMARVNSALGSSRSMLGSNLSIFNKGHRPLALRRASKISTRQVSNVSLAKNDDKSPQPQDKPFNFERNFSYDANFAGSELNIARVPASPTPGRAFVNSPKSGRSWRRMSEPVNDLPKHIIRKRRPVYQRQQTKNRNNNNIDNPAAQEAPPEVAVSREQDGAARDDLLKVPDDGQQKLRPAVLKGMHRMRQGSVSAQGNRDSPNHSDQDIEPEVKSKRQEVAKTSNEKVSAVTGDMLVFKIDLAEENRDSLEKVDEREDEHLSSPVVGKERRESRSPLVDATPVKELEIIEEQNEPEPDNGSEPSETSSLLQEEKTKENE